MNSKNVKKLFRSRLTIYYILVGILNLIGQTVIVDQYNLEEGPVIEGGFTVLRMWVNVFAFLFFMPLLILAVRGPIVFLEGIKIILQY